jgi:peroxiredoxin Q/BCP
MGMPHAGVPAPEFRLPAADGRTVSLADYRGRRVVLYFFVKANTSG